jgi:hypothetical protein
MHTGFICGYFACVYKLFDIGVVMCQAHKCAMMQKIKTRISYMSYSHAVIFYEEACASRPHTDLPFALRGALYHCSVGSLYSGAEEYVICLQRSLVSKRLDCDGTCYLSSSMATHAVADSKQGSAHKKRVLIVATNQAYIRADSPRKTCC